jgi:hypothetical protein
MADHGQIQYLQNIQLGGGPEWDSRVQIINYVLEARVRRLQDCEIKPEGVIHDQEDNEVRHLYFDT